MNLNSINYNNNLLYLAALENNIDLVSTLINKGFPKSPSDLTPTEKRNGSSEDLKDVMISYQNATRLVIQELLKSPNSLPMLSHYLTLMIEHKKNKTPFQKYSVLGGQAFFQGNIPAFELFCDIYGKEALCEQKSLLFYIHQARKNKKFSKKTKLELTKYVEDLGLDWSRAEGALVRWANMNGTKDDFQYFYHRRKQGLITNPEKNNLLRKELSNCIESFLKYSLDFEKRLDSDVLNYIAERSELKTGNPYEGYFIILRKADKIASYFNVDDFVIESYLYKIVERNPSIIKHLKKSKVKIPKLNGTIEKIKLRYELSKTLPNTTVNKKVNKV